MHVVVSGASGFVGSTLVDSLLRAGDRVTVLTRGGGPPERGVNRIKWDAMGDELDLSQAGRIDAVVHLAGANVAGKRWDAEYKALIRDSRVHGTRLIAKAIAALERKPPVMVMASAMGYYGDRGDEVLTEESPPGDDFLSEVGVEWERAADPAREAGVRVVATRFGHVLGRDGGMLPRQKLPYLLCLGGPMGSGKQWWPWVALEDVARAIRFVIERDDISGPVNVVAPGIKRQADFAKDLGKALGRPAFFPLPGWMAKLMLGELAIEVLYSRRMVPTVLEAKGFEFLGPDLPTVLHHVFRAPAESEWR